ncbi:MAG TPA: substrate-binding domain-containing protein [Steroidobacteraceae bacterium]
MMLCHKQVSQAVILFSALAVIATCSNASQSHAAEIKVFAVGATAPALKRIIPEYEKATGNKVVVWFGPPAPFVGKISKGETVDAVFISGPRYDDLVKSGAIDAGTIFAQLGVGIGIPKGSAKPDVSTADALKRTLLTARSIGGLASNNGSIGTETYIGFRKLGIADQMTPKYRIYPNGISVVRALVKGEIELGFSVVADMAAAKGIDYAGPYPPAIQTYAPIHATMRIGTKNEAAVRGFLDLVRSKATPGFLKENYLFPAPH